MPAFALRPVGAGGTPSGGPGRSGTWPTCSTGPGRWSGSLRDGGARGTRGPRSGFTTEYI